MSTFVICKFLTQFSSLLAKIQMNHLALLAQIHHPYKIQVTPNLHYLFGLFFLLPSSYCTFPIFCAKWRKTDVCIIGMTSFFWTGQFIFHTCQEWDFNLVLWQQKQLLFQCFQLYSRKIHARKQFTELRFISILFRDFPFTHNSCNCSDFKRNTAEIDMYFTQNHEK